MKRKGLWVLVLLCPTLAMLYTGCTRDKVSEVIYNVYSKGPELTLVYAMRKKGLDWQLMFAVFYRGATFDSSYDEGGEPLTGSSIVDDNSKKTYPGRKTAFRAGVRPDERGFL